MRVFAFLLAVVLLLLIWTNPNSEDFEKWIRSRYLPVSSNMDNSQQMFVRSKNYILFSYHEMYVQHSAREWDRTYYAGFGILDRIIVTMPIVGEWRKAPEFE
ncbi:hypothetical protein [Paenibacillus hexagrammi]|uniref:Uncharacterized protein n=1 Tax=Paenibacillus hexagrammi TaxID=2908839 RepID=A0ABY3SEZ9_9BACL|nr:hypothetical protein [Paenibacillus sp. YPD9-1]UJF32573.1 hypothetical protein L0M14_23450 [Paenibacillus sp. YPD9-1]